MNTTQTLETQMEITHTDLGDGYLTQLVSAQRLREILDAEGSDHSRPADFSDDDEWEVA